MTKRILSLLLFILAVWVILPAPRSEAQTATATIVGTVTDPQGAVVPDATVVAKNVATGIERTTKTSSEGTYRFDNLQPNIYDVRAEAQGFAAAEVSALKLQVGEQRDVNLALTVSVTVGQVNITSELPLVETTKTDVSTVIDDKQVATLPTTTAFNGIGGVANDYAGLATIAPGVKYDTTGVSSDLLGPGAVNNRGIQVNVDGGNISDQVVSSRDSLGGSVEEVKEFQVLTNNYNAEYGQAGGLILNVVTKSGSNQFHGDGHYYARGRNLTASTFFYNQSPDAEFRRAPFFKKEGGGTVGGPIIKNRTFFFTSYEQTRQGQPLTLLPFTGAQTVQQPTKELLYSGKIDHQLTKNTQLTARYNVQRDLQDNLLVQIAQIATPESLVSQVAHDNTLNIAATSTIGSNKVNEARFFFHRFLSQTPTKTDAPGLNGPNFYHGADFCCPQGGLQKRYQFIDNFSITRGTHTIKTGANITHFPYFSLFTQFRQGLYDFDSPEPNPGPASGFTVGLGPAIVNSKDNIFGFYAQDTWKIRPNLTLNYGLRYDVENGAFRGGTQSNGQAGGCTQGNGIIPGCSSDHNNFQPRVGIAYSPRFKSGFLNTLFGDADRSVIRLSFAEITQLAYLNVALDSLNFDGVNLLTVFTDDPAILAFAPNRPSDSALATLRPANFFGRVRPISNDLKNPEVRSANLTLTRQMGKNLVLNLGYTGVFGFGLFGERDRNYPVINADPDHPGYFYFGNRPDSRFLAERTNENSRTSSYNGFVVSATKRLSNHFQFQAGYTLSKLLTTSEDFFGLSEPADPRNIKAERALASNDVRHQGNFGFVYDTARFTNQSIAKHFVNNLNIGVIGQLQSARPYPISTGDGPFSGSIFFGAGNETVQRPNVLADGTLVSTNIASRGGGTLLVSQAAIAAGACPGCPQTTFLAPAGASRRGARDSFTGDIVDFQFLNGDLARNSGQTDPFYRFDVSVIKAFPIREQMRFEVKVDFFNVFNHTNFLLFNGNPNLSVLGVSADPNCRSCLNAHTGLYVGADGGILHIQDLRRGRLDSNLRSPRFNGLGNPTSTDLPRTIQLSGRFRF